MEQDHSWEYDAPSNVMDFGSVKDLDGADTSDHWFEQRASGSDAQLATPLSRGQHFGGASKGNLPKAIVCPYVEAEVDPAPNRNAARGPATRTRTNPSAQPRRSSAGRPAPRLSGSLRRSCRRPTAATSPLFQFKALELNRKILQQRQAARKPEEEERPVVFHPRPLPTRLLAEVVGVPDKKVAPPTVPESPAFALKKRVRLEPKAEEVKPPSPLRAHPVPHFGLPFQPRLPEKSQVESCPFSFDMREQESRVLKEKKLEMLRNEEVPKFKAQPLPDFHEVNLPERKVLLATKPEPFRLRVDERGGVKTDRWDKMVKEEQKRQVEATTFKARPNTVIHQEPFQPKKENRCAADDTNHSAVPEAFQLSTECRAVAWQEIERAAMEKEALRARMEEERRRMEEVREVEDVARMRHEQVHKAQPVRKYKPVEVRKCDTALTVPQSPKFSDRFHL